MDSDDKKIKTVMTETLKELVLPRLDRIEKKIDATMEMTAKNSEEITILQENVKDVLFTEERIETIVESSIRRQDTLSIKTDQLNRRVLKLETKKV